MSGDCRELQKAGFGEVGEVFQRADKLVTLSTDIGAAYSTKSSGCSPSLLASETPEMVNDCYSSYGKKPC